MALTKIPASLVDTTNHLELGDSEQVRFGDGNDLKIYHDGSHSRIVENGTGNLIIQGTNLDLSDTTTGETFLRAVSNGSVEVYYDGNKKFETTTDGATVTGDLSVTGDLNITGNVNSASVTDLDVTDKTITLGAGQTEGLSGGSGIIVDGSSASLLWDESADLWDFNKGLDVVGDINTSGDLNILKSGSGDATVNIKSTTGGDPTIIFNSAAANRSGVIKYQDNGTNVGRIEYVHNGDRIDFQAGSATGATMTVKNGKVGIGENTPANTLQIGSVGSTGYGGNHLAIGDGTRVFSTYISSTADAVEFYTNRKYAFLTSGAGGTGNVGIGTSDPSPDYGSDTVLEIKGSTAPGLVINDTGQGSKYGIHADSNDLKINYGTDTLITFQNDGYIGIGVTNPDQALMVKGVIETQASNSTNGWMMYTYTDNTFRINYNGSGADEIIVDSSGNVSIGTNTLASEMLEVAGTALVDNAKLKAIAKSNNDGVEDIFIYDTRKDSDGGAWRKRTQNTSWYNETLNTSTRGSRKEFPCVAVIISDTSTNTITIYDGDDSDMPMWMVFTAGSNGMANTVMVQYAGQDKLVHMLNGILIIGHKTSSDNYGSPIINFISEKVVRADPHSGEGGTWQGNISNRNSAYGYLAGGSVTVVNSIINDIAMTVLPNALIDADTGLPVPTIALATDGGTSIIKDNGSVVDLTSGSYGHSLVKFLGDDKMYIGVRNIGPNGEPLYGTFIDGIPVAAATSISTSNAYNSIVTSRTAGSYLYNSAYLYRIAAGAANGGASDVVQTSNGTAIGMDGGFAKVLAEGVKGQTTNEGLSSVVIKSDYNTGWMVGDIKLATLSDTDTTNVVGSELLTNTNFTSGTSPWVASQATISAGSNKLTITPNSGVNGGVYHSITTVVGKTYVAQVKVLADSGSLSRLIAAVSNNINDVTSTNLAIKMNMGNGTHSISFVATATTTYIWLLVGGGTGQATEFDDATVRLAEEDRSINGNGLPVFGTVTKSPVATGAELVAYSGFSSNSYLHQPYNADLQFGTGDFCATYWIKFSSVSSQSIYSTVGTGTASGTEGIAANTAGSGHLGFAVYNNGLQSSGRTNCGFNTVPALGVWYCIQNIRRNGQLEIWINGKLDSTSANTSDINAGDSITRIGGWSNGGHGGSTSIALFRISKTAPSPEQIATMYNDEKHLFAENAKATLYGSSDAITALAYDDYTELVHAGTSAGRSVFQGLNRIDNSTDAVGAVISASNGLIVED